MTWASHASVSSNPFLRPGSNRPPPKASPPPPPKKQIDPEFAREVELRGYFVLNGTFHFCIFNKKSQFGEWIRLKEQTFEEYEAVSFDTAEDTLTLSFSGQEFDIKLSAATGAPPPPSGGGSPAAQTVPPLPPSTTTSPSVSSGRYMPAKPTYTPPLPKELLQTKRIFTSGSSSLSLSRSSSGFSRLSNSSSIPSRTGTLGSPSSLSPGAGTSGAVLSSTSSTSASSPSSTGNQPAFEPSNSGTNVSLASQQESSQEAQSEEIDLENLPPPPPPPNILPPTGPPDLLPSREN